LEEWDNIPMRRINVLMNSMHRRIRAVTDTRGRGERGIRDIDELVDFTFHILGGIVKLVLITHELLIKI
jgi:hypothetical protein